MSYRATTAKLIAFLSVGAALAAYLVIVLGDVHFTATHHYTAIFTDVSYLKKGDEVRIAGAEVGKVDGVKLDGARGIKVTFEVDSDMQLTSETRATVRYKNLIGDRFLDLDQQSPGEPLPAGGTIPVSATTPALDLDTLLNGFKPLFSGLDPTQINDLSTEIVNVLQGQSSSIYSLLSSVASLTGTLGKNDAVIGDVITNLNSALSTIDDRAGTVSDLIVQLQHLVTGLAKDKDPITTALVHLNDVSSQAAALLAQVRPDLLADTTQLDTLATTLNNNTGELQYELTTLPQAYLRLARAGAYGNFFNFYMCALRFKLDGPNGPIYTPYTYADLARCK